MKVVFLILSMLALYSLCQKPQAIAHLKPTKDNDGISGTVLFTEEDDGSVTITVDITGIKEEYMRDPTDEAIGIHIHEIGSLDSEDGKAAGTHYVGNGKPIHGCPGNEEGTHAGDLGNFELEDDGPGVKKIDTSKNNKLIQMSGVHSIIGRAVVLHQATDECKKDDNAGNAGNRLAVGVIGLKDIEVETTTQAIVTKAICIMSEIDGSGVSGKVSLEQVGKNVKIVADIDGLTETKNAFHIHQFGDITPDGNGVGGHYDPHGEGEHGLPGEDGIHLGDLGNLVDGEYSGEITLSLSKKNGVVGRSMIIHEGEDTGELPFGKKLAQCVIGVLETESPSNEDENEGDGSAGYIITTHMLLLLLSVISFL